MAVFRNDDPRWEHPPVAGDDRLIRLEPVEIPPVADDDLDDELDGGMSYIRYAIDTFYEVGMMLYTAVQNPHDTVMGTHFAHTGFTADDVARMVDVITNAVSDADSIDECDFEREDRIDAHDAFIETVVHVTERVRDIVRASSRGEIVPPHTVLWTPRGIQVMDPSPLPLYMRHFYGSESRQYALAVAVEHLSAAGSMLSRL